MSFCNYFQKFKTNGILHLYSKLANLKMLSKDAPCQNLFPCSQFI